MHHQLVKRQLKKLGLDDTVPPHLQAWRQFLERVSQAYTEADRDRYLLERSLLTSSQEMQELYENLQKLSETRLAQEHDKLQTIIHSVGDGLCALDQEGSLLFINSVGERLLGWSAAELIGQPILELLRLQTEQADETTASLLRRLAGNGQIYRNEDGSLTRKDGVAFPASYVLNPITNKAVLLGAVLVFRDISERKQTEAELQKYRAHLEEQVAQRTAALTRANEQLQQEVAVRKQAEVELRQAHDQALEASRLKSELLAKVSHELRTPLGAILGYAELLELGIYGLLSADQSEATTKIIESTQYLANLVNELLDQARLEAGKLELQLCAFVPVDMIHDACARMKVLAQAKGLNLTSEIAGDVPLTLFGDPMRLQQILVNLISNAIKFTTTGEVHVRLYRPDPTYWAMEVADTGPGIPREAQAYIFEPFRQVDGSITRQYSGTGLGLSIVKQLAELMGGEVTLESEIGRGSTFTIWLPIHPVGGDLTDTI
jgi:PAS domain S-box-containing protein